MNSSLIDHISKQLGLYGLILQAKANEIFNKEKLTIQEIERLLILFTTNDSFFKNEIEGTKFLTMLLFLQAEYDNEKTKDFINYIDNWQSNLKSITRSGTTIDIMHIIFNIIEFQDKFKNMSNERLLLLKSQLISFEKLQKTFEEFILYKYYSAIISYYVKDYQLAKTYVMDIVVDLTDEVGKSSFIDYIELKNSILYIKMLENEGDSKEVLTNLECLYETFSKKDDMIAVKLSFKMCDVHMNLYEYEQSAKLLSKIYKKLKKLMLIGINAISYSEFCEICLNLISRIIYCNIMLGCSEESNKFVKKLEKLVSNVKDIEMKNSEFKEILITRYQFYFLIFKNISKQIDKSSDLISSINNYRAKFKNHIVSEDNIIINIYSLNSSDVLARNFFDKVNSNMEVIKSNKLLSVNYVTLFFSLYNQISILTKNMTTDSNIKKQTEYVEKIKNSSTAVVNYIKRHIDNYNLKYIFSYPYFKEVLIKIYTSLIFSYFFLREFKLSLDCIQEFEEIKTKLNLSDGSMIKYYVAILKLKADILLKTEDYLQACDLYSKVIQIYEEILNNSQSMALVIFNLGVSYLYTKEIHLSKKNLILSKTKYELLNSIHNNIYHEKVKHINQLLQLSIFNGYE